MSVSMKKTTLTRAEKKQLYEKLVATLPGIERKGDTIPYTSVNGHMYSMLTKGDELAIRLAVEERELFLSKYESKLLEQYGVVQKEYVVVPDHLLSDMNALKVYFEQSFKYVSAMKPKPTAKKKK